MIRLVKRKLIGVSASKPVAKPLELGLPPLPSEARTPAYPVATLAAASGEATNPYGKIGRILSAYSAKELDVILQDCDGRQREILLTSLLAQAAKRSPGVPA